MFCGLVEPVDDDHEPLVFGQGGADPLQPLPESLRCLGGVGGTFNASGPKAIQLAIQILEDLPNIDKATAPNKAAHHLDRQRLVVDGG